MKRLLISLLTIGVIGGSALGLSGAFFSDTETSTGNVLSAGTLDLQIDNTSYYNNVASPDTSWILGETIKKFFDFNDVKPGDVGEDTISVHVNDNDSWLCADVTLTSDDENGIQPVESVDGDTTDGAGNGELADRINFLWWADDGDNVLEVGESILPGGPIGALNVGETANVTLADSTDNIWLGSGPIVGGDDYYIGKAWCFGTLTPAPLTQDGVNNLVTPANSTGGVTCDGSGENNTTQTDSLTADISFEAVQSRNNPEFVCGGPAITPTPTTSITPTPTPPSEPFADDVPEVLGTYGNCCDANNLESSAAIAATKVTGAPDSPPDSDFIQISDSSVVTLKFVDNKAVDGPGNDVRIYIYDLLFPASAQVEMSDDCITYYDFGIVDDTLHREFDLDGSPISEVMCVRLTDQVAPGDPYPTLGFDLDAVEALNSVVVP